MIFRRRSRDPDLADAASAFAGVLEELEPAKAALAEAVPGTRLPGRPFSDALAAFVAGAGRAQTLMATWRRPSLEKEWAACSTGLERSLRLARAHPMDLPSEQAGFVGLVERIQAILDPLEPFEAADAAFRRRRS